jgi:hypothetical protein
MLMLKDAIQKMAMRSLLLLIGLTMGCTLGFSRGQKPETIDATADGTSIQLGQRWMSTTTPLRQTRKSWTRHSTKAATMDW